MSVKKRVKAIDRFIKGLKEDAVWSDIGSSAILTAWSNVAGAITPLRGNPHTSANLTDIDRGGLGIKGNGTTGYIDTNYPHNTDDQNDRHAAVWISEASTGSSDVYLGTVATNPTYIQRGTSTNTNFIISGGTARTRLTDTGLAAVNRRNGDEIETYISGSSETQSSTSGPPGVQDLFVLDRTIGSLASDGRVAYYSAGAATDLALLDARVSTLMSDLRSIEESDFDADALTYIRAVEEADGAYLETDVKVAINKLVVGLKFDSLWGSIGASCLLCGPRTLAGALVPLKGPAPQNNNFGSDNYNRETGLVGDATQTYLAIPYALSSDPNTDNHHCIVVTEPPSGSTAANASILGTGNRTITWNSPNYQGRNTVPFTYTLGEATAYPNFIGMARKPSPSQLHLYMNASLYTISQAAEATPTGDLTIFRNNSGGAMSDPRLSFFSVGRFLELPVLDSHITAYITAIGAAL